MSYGRPETIGVTTTINSQHIIVIQQPSNGIPRLTVKRFPGFVSNDSLCHG